MTSVIQVPISTHVSATEKGNKVVSIPGPAKVCPSTLPRLCTLLRRITNREMSIAKAIRVRKAARKERSIASMTSMTCEESEERRAINVTTAATVRNSVSAGGWASRVNGDVPTGCTARPRVAPGPIVTMFERDSISTV